MPYKNPDESSLFFKNKDDATAVLESLRKYRKDYLKDPHMSHPMAAAKGLSEIPVTEEFVKSMRRDPIAKEHGLTIIDNTELRNSTVAAQHFKLGEKANSPLNRAGSFSTDSADEPYAAVHRLITETGTVISVHDGHVSLFCKNSKPYEEIDILALKRNRGAARPTKIMLGDGTFYEIPVPKALREKLANDETLANFRLVTPASTEVLKEVKTILFPQQAAPAKPATLPEVSQLPKLTTEEEMLDTLFTHYIATANVGKNFAIFFEDKKACQQIFDYLVTQDVESLAINNTRQNQSQIVYHLTNENPVYEIRVSLPFQSRILKHPEFEPGKRLFNGEGVSENGISMQLCKDLSEWRQEPITSKEISPFIPLTAEQRRIQESHQAATTTQLEDILAAPPRSSITPKPSFTTHQAAVMGNGDGSLAATDSPTKKPAKG